MNYGLEDWYCVLSESYVDKQINKAARYIEKNHARLIGLEKTRKGNPKTAKDLANDVRHIMPVLDSAENGGKKPGKFIVGASRIFYDELDGGNHRDVSAALSRTIQTLIRNGHEDQYDENLNGMSFDQLEDEFSVAKKVNMEKDKKEISSKRWTRNPDYTIVRINSTEETAPYRKYLNPQNPWCITQSQDYYNNYTHGGVGLFYFVLKRGYESLKPIEGENTPHDEYGESMMAVSVGEDGELLTCTSRWNGSGDFFNAKQLSELLGVDFYKTFLPRPFEETVQVLGLKPMPPETFAASLGYMRITASNAMDGFYDKLAKPDFESKKIDYVYYHCDEDEGNEYLYSKKTGRVSTKNPVSAYGKNDRKVYWFPSDDWEEGDRLPLFVPSSVRYVSPTILKDVTKLEIEEGNPVYRMSGGCVYANEGGEKKIVWISPDSESISVEEGVKTIDFFDFRLPRIKSVVLPEGLEEIAYKSFECKNTLSINFPRSLKRIGKKAFESSVLDTVDLPEGVSLCDCAFFDTRMKRLRFHANADRFEDGAFHSSYLENVEIVSGECIPAGCFYGATIGTISLPDSLKTICPRSFAGCQLVRQAELAIPEGVTTVGSYAFSNSNIKEIRFSENSTVRFGTQCFEDCLSQYIKLPRIEGGKIEAYDFSRCRWLKSFVVPNGTKFIEGNAFMWCESLEYVYIPEGVCSIDSRAFYGCSELKWINVPSTVYQMQTRRTDSIANTIYVHESLKNKVDVLNGTTREEIVFYRNPSELPFHPEEPSVVPAVPQESQSQPAMESFSGWMRRKTLNI